MLGGRLSRTLVAQAGLLALILLVAVGLRLSGHNWDEGQHINVDELSVTKVTLKRVNIPPGASITALLDPQNSPINPRAGGDLFVYGALPLYVIKVVSSAASALTGDNYFTGLDGTLQIGRLLAGLFDTLTALLVFAIGARLWGVSQGLIASAFYTLSILPIQTSHFFISDPFMSTFMAATLLCSIAFYQTRRAPFILLAGLFAGLAMACKVSAFPVIALPMVAVLMQVLGARHDTPGRVAWGRALIFTGLAAGGAFIGFFVGDPFAILDPSTYLAQLGEQAQIQSGAIDEWFTRKYVGTWPVLHLLGQLFLVSSGPLVALAGVLGVSRVWKERHGVEGLLLVGAGTYFASIALLEIKWVRYLMPLVPYLCLFATAFGFWVYTHVARRDTGQLLRWAVPATLLLSALLGAVAISSIFRSEHTQLKASRWVYDNVAPGSRLGIEKTALLMPLPLPGHKEPETEYTLVEMDPLADKPSQAVVDTLRAHLRQVDYLVIDAAQAAATVPHLPWRYPVQIRYYDLLLAGRLGFVVALHSTSYPRIGNLQIPDDGGWIDVSFMDSSHPPIWVLKKERDLSDEEWAALFAEAISQPSIASRRRP